jgi:hypothetical protein
VPVKREERERERELMALQDDQHSKKEKSN